jgi:hypothetical protein
MLEFDALPERIKQKIRFTESGCWEWTACIDTPGYGRIYWEGKLEESHRVVYELLVKPIPDGLVIDHMCHTSACGKTDRECPHRRCQNPAHFKVVTQGSNALRGDSPPAVNARKDACDNGHEYTPETMVMDGGNRRCKICRREADKRRRPRGTPRPYRKAQSEFRPMPGFPEQRVEGGRETRRARVREMAEAGQTAPQMAAALGVSNATVYLDLAALRAE